MVLKVKSKTTKVAAILPKGTINICTKFHVSWDISLETVNVDLMSVQKEKSVAHQSQSDSSSGNHESPVSRCWDNSQDKLPAWGTRLKVNRSPKTVGIILWEPYIFVQNFMANLLATGEIFQPRPKWCTDRQTNIAILKTTLLEWLNKIAQIHEVDLWHCKAQMCLPLVNEIHKQFSPALMDNILFCTVTTLASSDMQRRCAGILVSWVFCHMTLPTERIFIKEVRFIKNIFLQGGLVDHHGCTQVHYYTRVIAPVPSNTAVLKRLL